MLSDFRMIKKKAVNFIAVTALPVFLYLALATIFQSTRLDFTIETDTLFVVSGDIAPDTLLIFPMDLDTYSDGSFIVKEMRQNDLKLFDEDGNYQKTLTRRGRGPGEFLEIEYFFIDRNDRLLVIDKKLAKLTVFKSGGSSQGYSVFNSRPSIRSLHQKKDGTYLLGFRRDYNPGAPLQKREFFFSMSPDFELSDSGFVHPEELTEEEPGSLPYFVLGSVSFTENSVLSDSDDLIVAPKLYSGRMVVYRSDNEYSEPEYLKVNSYGPAYKEYPSSRPLTFELVYKEGINSYSTGSGSVRFYHLNRSLGLFRLNTGELIHFVQIWEKNKSVLMVELLDRNATKVVGTKQLDKLGDLDIQNNIKRGKKYGHIALHFLHLDDRNQLFISKINKDNEEAELHVIQLNVTIAE